MFSFQRTHESPAEPNELIAMLHESRFLTMDSYSTALQALYLHPINNYTTISTFCITSYVKKSCSENMQTSKPAHLPYLLQHLHPVDNISSSFTVEQNPEFLFLFSHQTLDNLI